MGRLATKLRSRSYRVHNLNYPSTAHTIEVLADQTLHKVVGPLIEEGGPLIHFVSHSIGGIIIRYYLKHHKVPNLGRVVMLAPPTPGSDSADLSRESFSQTLPGPAGGPRGTRRGAGDARAGLRGQTVEGEPGRRRDV